MSSLLVASNRPWTKLCCSWGDFLSDSCKMLGSLTTVSRINYKPDVFRFFLKSEKISEIMALPTVNSSFGELCDKRGFQILEKIKENDQRLKIMWSGGIDSTLVFVSILKNWPKEYLKRVDVVLSASSIAEYTKFYIDHIQFKFPIINSATVHFDRYFEGSIVLTGEHGDQLFGSDIVQTVARSIGVEELKRVSNYKDFIIKIFSDRLGLPRATRFFNHYEPIIDEAPFPIRNAVDFLWWWNFSQKWQNVKFRELHNSMPENLKRNTRNLIHFYDTPEFQKWSIENHDKKIPGDLWTYKMPAKNAIIEFTKDECYARKLKYGSQAKIAYFRDSKRQYNAITRYGNFTNHIEKYLTSGFTYK